MIPFLQSFSSRYDRLAHTVVADSGYGSAENYRFMSENGMEAYVKYNYFHMEQLPRFKPDPFKAENFYYNEEQDFCICPMGQKMQRIGTRHVKTASGYVSENARYTVQLKPGQQFRKAMRMTAQYETYLVNEVL